jgi:hypothetical protein
VVEFADGRIEDKREDTSGVVLGLAVHDVNSDRWSADVGRMEILEYVGDIAPVDSDGKKPSGSLSLTPPPLRDGKHEPKS